MSFIEVEMNATQRRPEHKSPNKASYSLAYRGCMWFDGWCGANTKPDRRVQHTRVGEDRRKNTTTRYQDGKPPVVRVAGKAIASCMRRKITRCLNDPNVLLPILAFFIVTLTSMMVKAGVL